MKYFFTTVLLLFAANVFAQDTTSTSLKKDSLYVLVEEMPQFPGGDQALFKFLAQNMRYPAQARERGIQGKVYITFWVEEDGKINNVDVVKSPHKSLSEEALRVAYLMPKWIPGKQNGRPIKVKWTLPINFALK